METSIFLLSFLLHEFFSFLNGSEEKRIYLVGIVESENTWDGISSITLQMTDGELKGKRILIYFSTNFEGYNKID